MPIDEREDRVILADADVECLASTLRPTLANDDVAGE